MSTEEEDLTWPVVEVPAVVPVSGERRAWRNISHNARFQLQHEQLLTETRELAAEVGYAQTSVSEVVARAGVSRRTFYEHFGSKEGCFAELILRAGALAISSYPAAVEGSLAEGPTATFLAIIEAWADSFGTSTAYSYKLTVSLYREPWELGSPMMKAMGNVTDAGVQVLYVAARRLGSALPSDLLRLASRQQLHGLVGAVEPGNGRASRARHLLLAQVVAMALGFAPDSVPSDSGS